MPPKYVDLDRLIELRRRLHRCPEIGFELHRTVAIVKEELENIGIEYVADKYAPCSVVADINPEKKGFTIAFRADMDALPVTEDTGLPFSSEIEGQMHACGHDAHTASLLTVARALYEMRDSINCRVRLIFQPDEEGAGSAAGIMVKNGVLDGVDLIVGLHVDNRVPAGKIAIRKGPLYASCRNFVIEMLGHTSHASCPHKGSDALAAAVAAYCGIQAVRTRMVDPLENCFCSVGALNSGHAHNVVPDYAAMKVTTRTYNMDVDKAIFDHVVRLSNNAAEDYGCECRITSSDVLPCVYNNHALTELVRKTAVKVLGEENVIEGTKRMGSEDYADFAATVPGVFFEVGTADPAREVQTTAHGNDFTIYESFLDDGANIFVQFVLDHMNGVTL